MKFTEMLVVLVFVFSLYCSFSCECRNIYKLNKVADQYNKKNSANHFITESFRITCNGKGFDSLNEWQCTCREMWKLDYIGWADASEFMEVDYSLSDKLLMYGKWKGNLAEGEVYSRSVVKK